MIFDIKGLSDNPNVKKFFDTFKFFPTQSSQQDTTWKRRTWLQSQRNKADVYDKKCRDFIFSDLPIKNGQIELLGGLRGRKQDNLMTNEHPFDHFVVSGTVEVPKKK